MILELLALPLSRSQCEIWRRYKDLQLLSKQLETIHQQAKSLIGFPFLIKASYLGGYLSLSLSLSPSPLPLFSPVMVLYSYMYQL